MGRSVGRFRLKSSRCAAHGRRSVGRTAPTQFFRRAAHGQWVGRSGQIPIVPVSCGAPPTRSPLSHAPLSSHRVTARRRCAMPVGRSDGCLSTTRCHGMCVQKPVTFSSPSGCTFTQCSLPGPDQKALRVTVFTARRRCAMPVGRSYGHTLSWDVCAKTARSGIEPGSKRSTHKTRLGSNHYTITSA